METRDDLARDCHPAGDAEMDRMKSVGKWDDRWLSPHADHGRAGRSASAG